MARGFSLKYHSRAAWGSCFPHRFSRFDCGPFFGSIKASIDKDVEEDYRLENSNILSSNSQLYVHTLSYDSLQSAFSCSKAYMYGISVQEVLGRFLEHLDSLLGSLLGCFWKNVRWHLSGL